MSSEKYPGYEELISYLTRSRDKSFWSFLLRCRDTILVTTSATSRKQDLEGTWISNFLLEARKLGEDLEEMKQEIEAHKSALLRLQLELSEINKKVRRENAEFTKNSMDEDFANSELKSKVTKSEHDIEEIKQKQITPNISELHADMTNNASNSDVYQETETRCDERKKEDITTAVSKGNWKKKLRSQDISSELLCNLKPLTIGEAYKSCD
ncbi:3692_t:CDS:2 [Diversispora eburnea]|uniref:3692_t:CDS:1 n=1 Tax=Diversispora eburnea TaxID=1213867 RepID=A0A9N8W0T4_9GLOM|nr:3692_t:CDS:2 [Diversispora eburnea]